MAVIHKLNENFVATQVDDEILLIDLKGGELFSLSGTAKAVWEMIDGKRDIHEIASALCSAFEAPVETIEDDVRSLVRSLSELHLVGTEL